MKDETEGESLYTFPLFLLNMSLSNGDLNKISLEEHYKYKI